MKRNYLFLLVLLSVVSGLYGTNNSAEKTYTIEVKYATLNAVEIAWHRADGMSDDGLYCCEYGIKGFKRGEGILDYCYNHKCFRDLKPDTEYSLFIRKQTDKENDPVWFEEYNFKTLACNAEILGIFHRGIKIHSYGKLVDIEISFDDTAESYELEYGEKGFLHGEGNVITSILGDGQQRVYVNIGNENLQSNTEYDYYVRGKCGETYGEWSEKRTFVTTDMFHYEGDETFEVFFEDITRKTATAIWKRIESDSYFDGYRIEYGVKGFERGKGENVRITRNNTYSLEGLLPDTEYSFFIRSEGKSTESPVWSVEHNFRTLPCDSEISNIETLPLIPTGSGGGMSWLFQWDDTAESYELEYGEQGFEIGMGEKMYVEENYIYFFTGELKANTDYEYRVRGKCGDEYGEWSEANCFYSGDSNGGWVGMEDNQVPCLKIYPNPTDGIVSVDLDLRFDFNNVTLVVYGIEGTALAKFKYQSQYDLSFLPAGVYMLSFSDGEHSETIILQKI